MTLIQATFIIVVASGAFLVEWSRHRWEQWKIRRRMK